MKIIIDKTKIEVKIYYQKKRDGDGEEINRCELFYNGVCIGTTIWSHWNIKHKTEEDWCKKQLKKRLKVIKTNIDRLNIEKENWENEYELLTN